MASRTILPAKLTRPSATGLLKRERLFRSLDGMREGRCIWVSGPAGAGKTSLVSSWLETNKHKTAWYQADAGDEDPATVFHYLHLLPKSITRKRIDLPHLTPEYLPALEAFIRRFFEAFFELFKTPFVLVFDNCQEARAESSFPMILDGAFNALPDGGLIICLSRDEPPPGLARWRADHAFKHIGWDELRFTAEEAGALARLAGEQDAATIRTINSLTRGWAVGLRLLLRARTVGLEVDANAAPTPQSLFDYFATEILNKIAPTLREFLLRTSIPPSLTPQLAQQLSGYDKAAETLAWLHRNRLFTERRLQARAETSYEFHPLFREFLLERARAQLPAAEFSELQKKAAALLEESGRIDDAAALWCGAKDWRALERLVLRQAPALMMQGRIATLEEWILALPESLRDGAGWILYLLGVCRSLRDPPLARTSLEKAYERFRAEGDAAGAFLAVGNLIGSYFLEWGLVAPLDRWIGEFESLLNENDGVIPEAVEVQVLGSLQGILHRRPDHPMLPSLVERSRLLSRSLADADQRLTVSMLAIHYFSWAGQRSAANIMREELASIAESARSNPPRIIYWIWSGFLLTWEAEYEDAKKSHTKALDLAQQSGLRVIETIIYSQLGATEATQGNADDAARLFDAAWALRQPWQVVEIQTNRFARATVCLLRGEIGEAVALAREAAQPVLGHGSPYGEAWLSMQLGYILMHDGQHAEAREHLLHALAFARHMPTDSIRFPVLVALAWSHFDTGEDTRAIDYLKEALAVGHLQGYRTIYLNWVPGVMSRLCAKALRYGIETAYVSDLIRRHRLLPPADDVDFEEWPWPVRIHTLGRFAALINDKPLTFPTRAQKKPLELLKALIALGGRSVGITVLTGHLWPDLEGDAAQNACSVALYRLRRLLGDEDVLEVQEGTLSLDPQRVWVDTWAFERLTSTIDTPAQAPIADNSSVVEELAASMLRLYPGHFLLDEEAPWAIAYRERLRSRFLRAGSVIGTRLEAARRMNEAVDLYRRAIEQDPLAETFYRGLMRSLKARGQVAEALEAYRRCRDILSITLGVEPSAETQALYRSLKT